MLVFDIDRDEIFNACNSLRDALGSRDKRYLSIFATDSYIILSIKRSKIWIQKILLPVRHESGNNYVGSGDLSFDIDVFIGILSELPSATLAFRENSKFFGVSCADGKGIREIDSIDKNFSAPTLDEMSKYALFSASFLFDSSVKEVFRKAKKMCSQKSSLAALNITEKKSELIVHDDPNSLSKIAIVMPNLKLKRYGIFGLDIKAVKVAEKFGAIMSSLPVWIRIYRGYSSVWVDDMNFTSVHSSEKIDEWNQMRKTFNSLVPVKSTKQNKIVINKSEVENILETYKRCEKIVMTITEDKKLIFKGNRSSTETSADVGSKTMLGVDITLPYKYLANVVETLDGNIINIETIDRNGIHVLYITDGKTAEHLRMLDKVKIRL